MQSLLIMCLLGISVCCYKLPKATKRDIHPYLLPYVEQFEERTDTRINFRVSINNSLQYVGKCYYSTEDYMGTEIITPEYIEINLAFFDKLSTTDEYKSLGIEQVFAHEAIHCLKGRHHNDSLDKNNCPVSVMFTYEFGATACYKTNRARYLQEVINAFKE